MKILTIDYQSSDYGKVLVESLHHTGFAIIENHPVSHPLINEVYTTWSQFFSSDIKNNYMFHPEKQDGYFPMLSEHAKGYAIKDLKEFYHIYPWGRYPKEINDKSKELYQSLYFLSNELLTEINIHTPQEIKNSFSMPLHEMSLNSPQNLMRIIHYPKLSGHENKNAIRAAPHQDINLITLLVVGSEPGLQILTKKGEWIDVPYEAENIVINTGDMLQECSKEYFPSTTHRVINPQQSKNVSRYSMPFFVHPRDEVPLSDRYTASSYLEERLKEIGLK